MKATVYIIRHAEAEGNIYRRCHGIYNSLLTPRAYQQLPCLAKRFESVPLAAVYASPCSAHARPRKPSPSRTG